MFIFSHVLVVCGQLKLSKIYKIILANEHLDWARKNDAFSVELKKHIDKNPFDKIPIPLDEPDPQVTTLCDR
jgi:hypothetical protein